MNQPDSSYRLLFRLIRNPLYDLRHLRSINQTIGEYLPPCYLACAKFILFEDRRLDRTSGDSFGLRVHRRDLTCGPAKPVCEACLAQLRVIAGDECAFAQLHAVVARVRVSYNLARILACG